MRTNSIELKADDRQCRELGRALDRENVRMAELPAKIHPLNNKVTRIRGRIAQLEQRLRLLLLAPTPLLRGPVGATADIMVAAERANIEAETRALEGDLVRLESQRDELERQLRGAARNADGLSTQMRLLGC